MTRVLFHCWEPIGERMAGPGIRCLELARTLARAGCEVTIAAPDSRLDEPAITLLDAAPQDYGRLLGAIRDHDVVIAERLPPHLLHTVSGLETRYVADLYNPIVVESAQRNRGRGRRSQRRRAAVVTAHTVANLACADFIVCASERQRDLWLGMLSGHGLLDAAMIDADPSLRSLIDVVASGLPGDPPPPGEPHLRALPEVGDADRILVWGGGIWPWLDAITPIKAVERLEAHRPAVHLHFPAVDRPQELSAVEMASAREAIAFAERRGLLGRRVHVGGAWVPYERRAEYLLEADLGISAHPDHLESRYAFRSRVLDYLWAGLPVVATRGDVLAELIERGGAGRAVAAGDDRAFADACAALLDDEAALDAARAAAARVAAAHRWERVAGPLVDYCLGFEARPRPSKPRRLIARSVAGLYPGLLAIELEERGAGGVARKLSRNALTAVAPRRRR